MAVRGFSRSPQPTTLPAAHWIQGDVTDYAALHTALADCAAVFHLATFPLRESFQQPRTDFAVNAVGMVNVLEAARDHQLGKVIYTSTGQIYGYPSSLPLTEDMPARPASPYAASKYAGEIMCRTYFDVYGLNTTIFRIANAYGAALDGREQNSVDAIFMRLIAAGKTPTINGSPHEARDFLHISELVEALILGWRSDAANGEVFNLGRGIMVTLAELIAIIAALQGVNITPHIPNPDAAAMQHHHEMSKIRRVLGFDPQIVMKDGLAMMMPRDDD